MYIMDPVREVSRSAHKVVIAAADDEHMEDVVRLRAAKVIRDAIADLECALDILGVEDVKLSPETDEAIAQYFENDPGFVRRMREAIARRN